MGNPKIMLLSPQVLHLRHQDAKIIEKFRFNNFEISLDLKANSTMRNQKIMVLSPKVFHLTHFDAKIDLKIPILYFPNIKIALSQIDNGESKNHDAETSGPTLETPGCKNY